MLHETKSQSSLPYAASSTCGGEKGRFLPVVWAALLFVSFAAVSECNGQGYEISWRNARGGAWSERTNWYTFDIEDDPATPDDEGNVVPTGQDWVTVGLISVMGLVPTLNVDMPAKCHQLDLTAMAPAVFEVQDQLAVGGSLNAYGTGAPNNFPRFVNDGMVVVGEGVAPEQGAVVVGDPESQILNFKIETETLHVTSSGNLRLSGAVQGTVTNEGTILIDDIAVQMSSASQAVLSVAEDFRQSSAGQLKIVLNASVLSALVADQRYFLEIQGSAAFDGELRLEWDISQEVFDMLGVQVGDRYAFIKYRALTGRFSSFRGVSIPRTAGSRGRFFGLNYTEEGVELIVLWEPELSSNTRNPNTVLVTHGLDGSENSVRGLANTINANIGSGSFGAWTVAVQDYADFADYGFSFVYMDYIAEQAHEIGESLAFWFADKGYRFSNVHVISGSLGSWVIDGFVDRVKALPGGTACFCHATYLDAWTRYSINLAGETTSPTLELGDTADWAEHYMDRRFLVGGAKKLPQMVNINVAATDPHWMIDDLIEGFTVTGQMRFHVYPWLYYERSITDSSLTWGFRASREYLAALPGHARYPRNTEIFLNPDGTVGSLAIPESGVTLDTAEASSSVVPSGSVSTLANGFIYALPTGAVATTTFSVPQGASYLSFRTAVNTTQDYMVELRTSTVTNFILSSMTNFGSHEVFTIPLQRLGTSPGQPVAIVVHNLSNTNLALTISELSILMGRTMPPLLRLAIGSDGRRHLRFEGGLDTTFGLERSGNLVQWTNLYTNSTSTPLSEFIDQTSPLESKLFYRTRLR